MTTVPAEKPNAYAELAKSLHELGDRAAALADHAALANVDKDLYVTLSVLPARMGAHRTNAPIIDAVAQALIGKPGTTTTIRTGNGVSHQAEGRVGPVRVSIHGEVPHPGVDAERAELAALRAEVARLRADRDAAAAGSGAASAERQLGLIDTAEQPTADDEPWDSDDDECEGHESLDGAHMGETVYCDGTCRTARRKTARPASAPASALTSGIAL